MPLFLRSADGLDADNGSTWALAKASMGGIDSIDTAGETIYVAHTHSETPAALTYNFAGTVLLPTRIISVDSTGDPATPTTALAGATINTQGAGANLQVAGSVYMYKMKLVAGAAGAANVAQLLLNTSGSNHQYYESCELWMLDTHSSAAMSLGNAAAGNAQKTSFKNCWIKNGAQFQTINLHGQTRFQGGGLSAGIPEAVNGLFAVGASGGPSADCEFVSFDFSALSATSPLFQSPGARSGRVSVRDSILPASWTASLVVSAFTTPYWRASLTNCKSGSTIIYRRVQDAFGTIQDFTTIYRTSGASIRAVPLSLRMTTSANSKYPSARFESDPMSIAYPGTAAEDAAFVAGTTKAVTVEFVHDTNVAAGQGAGTSFAFRNNEFALEVTVRDAVGGVTSTTYSSAPTDLLATAADITSSSVGWTTAGLTTPVKQKFVVNVVPQEKGTITAKIIGYAAGKTIYYDPMMTVT